MPIEIHGKQYVTVAERVTAFHEEDLREGVGTPIEIETGIWSEDIEQVTMWAKVTTAKGKFTGHARSSKSSKSIEGQSPLEVAETSAVGRALGFAGYGLVEGIASADEIVNATPLQSEAPTGAPPASPCPHGMRVWKSGTKNNRRWQGYFCPKNVKDCVPVWVGSTSTMPMPERDMDDDFPFE